MIMDTDTTNNPRGTDDIIETRARYVNAAPDADGYVSFRIVPRDERWRRRIAELNRR